jgi:voltage-gated potassium channel
MFNYSLIKRLNWLAIFGVGMVTEAEHSKFARLNNVISSIYILITVILMWQWQAVVHGRMNVQSCLSCDWLVWFVLLTTYVVTLCLVADKKRFILHNWFLLLILGVGLIFLFQTGWSFERFRHYRPILAVVILLPALRFLINFFLDGRLWTTIMAALVIVCIFGLLVSGVDPAIHSASDGLWWALATVSTVGYGDVVPQSDFGRIIGAILVLVGLGVFVVITANFLSIMWRNEEAQGSAQKDFVLDEVEKMIENQNIIRKSLQRIEGELKELKGK